MIQLEQTVEHIADGVLVIHQDAEGLRIVGQQEFLAQFIRDNILFVSISIIKHVFPFVLSYGIPPLS